MAFQKGVCPNPNGRPKGALSEHIKKFMKVKALASEKYEDAFKLLWEAMEAKEGWAHQLYFKELVPRRIHQHTVFVEAKDDSVESQIDSLRKGLAEFTEHTEESLIGALKALSGIKANEIATAQTNVIESRESLMEKIKAIETIIKYKEENEK